MKSMKLTSEQWIVLALFACAALSAIFVNSLVAPPKVLFGRSLTAITPSLFPLIILSALAILCGAFFVWRHKNPGDFVGNRLSTGAWVRGTMLFAIMTLYALLMEPVGFWISSALSLTLLSWLAGNRSIPQIAALSLISPVLLYLAATRLLAVSLPELNTIELFYARVLGL